MYDRLNPPHWVYIQQSNFCRDTNNGIIETYKKPVQDCRKPQAHCCKLPNTTGPFLSVVSSITAIDSLHERRQRKNPVPGLINKSQLRRKGQLDYRSHMLGTSSTPPPTKHTAIKLLASNSTIAIANVADTTAPLRARLTQTHSKLLWRARQA
jgi:hypothetical protein